MDQTSGNSSQLSGLTVDVEPASSSEPTETMDGEPPETPALSDELSPVTSEDDFDGGLRNNKLRGGFLASKYSNRLREILYPSASEFPNSIDMDLWLMKAGIYGPTKRLVKCIDCLAKFINREGTEKPIVDFLAVARSELANDGWPMDQIDEVKFAWGIFYGTFGFHHPTGLYQSFNAMVRTLFPAARRQAVIDFTLADLQRFDITVKATQLMHEHLEVRGDHVMVYILDEMSSLTLRTLHTNIIASRLGIADLGKEIQSSIYALVGEDSTYRYSEAEALGILPQCSTSYARTPIIRLAKSANRPPKLLASRVLAIQRLITSRRRWWNVLARDIKRQSETQPFVFYGAILAIFFGVCSIIQTIASVWAVVLALKSSSCSCS